MRFRSIRQMHQLTIASSSNVEKRKETSSDGSVELTESAATVGGPVFFPQRTSMGMDSREVTPGLTRAVVHLAAKVRFFQRAEVTTERVLGQKASQSTIRRLATQVGVEIANLEQLEERADGKEAVVPEVAVAACDGGRIRTREPGRGRGVRLCGESGWRETKNSSVERMARNDECSGEKDPCPDLPTSFRTASKVANITENPIPEVTGPEDYPRERMVGMGPQRVLRTAVSSMVSSDQFGSIMQREAKRRRFYEASCRAFIGDGLSWNWSIWKEHFPTFVPILDFIHAIQYVFAAASAITFSETETWKTYVRVVTLCWQGKVDSVIAELKLAAHKQSVDVDRRMADDDPHKPLVDAIRYLTNNRSRMDYPGCRQLGLPVTSAPMESLIKQINYRVKGTEMFWDAPEGAEAILHLRVAALSDDNRLDNYLSKRPGWPFVRRSSAEALSV